MLISVVVVNMDKHGQNDWMTPGCPFMVFQYWKVGMLGGPSLHLKNFFRGMDGVKTMRFYALHTPRRTSIKWPFIPNNCMWTVHIWMFPEILVPQNGWFIMENLMNKWMIWGYHYFWKYPYIRGYSRDFLFCTMTARHDWREAWANNGWVGTGGTTGVTGGN